MRQKIKSRKLAVRGWGLNGLFSASPASSLRVVGSNVLDGGSILVARPPGGACGAFRRVQTFQHEFAAEPLVLRDEVPAQDPENGHRAENNAGLWARSGHAYVDGRQEDLQS